ncbi:MULTISPECIES: glutamate synthase subunit beta [Petrotoga]|uniref:NAD(P)H-dependent glutamate synthase small subunit n=4 Tax=Petrotoga TaxID=28236 RepID=A0A4V3GQQ7_9BACT|nr:MULTISPECIES: glutamate synthase subunit beta [Petrotoga]PNR94893.1 glutamate synthase subunit beta [Petrotoga olearia DSM 13574]POZ87937.1 glutamate synthase [Petrotoga sibirica DSM 13575]RMA73182.1 NAD(P)H-dependent glutamate synthase small subunit [Petrotoga olearia]TDX16093.1 NAD(P)H-dependent glutamate synthase small subunit [Petrotoga sibirica]
MGDPQGFLKYERKTPEERSSKIRINDWEELYIEMEKDELRMQAARCMNCGTPFCHSGILINHMVSGCPLNNLIPEWNDLVYRNLWREAYERLIETNSFPEFTGRVCPAPCEKACVNNLVKDPVSIKSIEYYIIEEAFKNGWVEVDKPSYSTGKKVAVVGSGPAGLSCAWELNRYGHEVTVFEKNDYPGGLLTYGIPNMKLDKKIVKRRIELMGKSGIQFKTNVDVGKDYPAQKLKEEFDAVVLCGGTAKARDLNVEGRNLNGIYFATEFLKSANERILSQLLKSEKDIEEISAKGKSVIVIGGGDTGTDCVGVSLRQGCKSVVQFEIMDKPPLLRGQNNPWPEWPKVLTVDYAQEEYAELFGKDPRLYNISTKRFVGDTKGNVKEVHTVEVEWEQDKTGKLFPRKIDGTEKVWKADLVLLALGFLGPEKYLIEQLNVEIDKRSNVKTEEGKYSTNVEGIFSAGDMRRGQSLVVWAINEAKQAAKECNEYLISSNNNNNKQRRLKTL